MKRNTFILALAVVAASAAPLAAQSNGGKAGRNTNTGVYDRNGDGRIDSRDQVNQGCNWWDINCTGNRAGTTVSNDGQWHQIGRDQSGNILYQRRRNDGYGNTVVETARRDSWGRMVLIDSRVLNNNGRQTNGQIYGRGNQNSNGVYGNGDNDDNGNGGRYDVGKGHGQGHAYGHYKNKNKNKNR